MKKKITFCNAEGCSILLTISVVVMTVSCFIAYMISNDFGKVKVSELDIDARGSVMQATLYTPANINSEDSVPAVIVTHGLSCNHSAVNGLAEELAKRGFVALSVSGYGSGASETSDGSDPSFGIYDALNYVRTLKYVDQTRIGMVGHSQGSKNVSAAVDMDGSLFTLNDLKLNILHDTFGIEISKDDLALDADQIASEKLRGEDLNAYKKLAEESTEYYNTRVKSALILGGNWGSLEQSVNVAGNEVTRVPNVNIGYEIALFNEGRAGTGQQNLSNPDMEAKFQTTDAITPEMWYSIKQGNSSERPVSEKIGEFDQINAADDQKLVDALNARTTRIIFNQVNGHARDYFSANAAQYVVKYFEQTLQWKNGNLTAEKSIARSSEPISFMARETFDLIALISMCVGMVAFAGLMLNKNRYRIVSQEVCKPFVSKKDKSYWIISILSAVGVFCAEYLVAKKGPMLGFKQEWLKHLLSLDFTANIHLVFMWVSSLTALVLLLVFAGINKKKGVNVFKELKVKITWKQFFRTFELAIITIASAYIACMVMKYFFHQDLRFWDTGVKDMLPQYWMLALRYSIVILPAFLVNSIFINAGRMCDMSENKNIVLQMVFASIGVYFAAAISYGVCYYTYYSTGIGNAPSIALISTWAMLVNLPLFAYLYRKFYLISGNVWLGALVNTWLVCWMMCSGQSATGYYLLTNFATKWLGIF